MNLLEAVKASGQKPRVILVGSGVCYGNPAPEWIPVREDCPLRPNNPYAASKAAADLLGVQHYLAHGTDVVIVRPFNHAGPRQSLRYVLAALALQVAEVELRPIAIAWRSATSMSSATSPTSATLCVPTVFWHKLAGPAKSITSAAARASASLMLWSTFARWQPSPFRSVWSRSGPLC